MKLTAEMCKALEDQANKELASYYLYKAMAGWADNQGLVGATSWLHKQAEEEKGHFEKFFSYICDRGNVPELQALEAVGSYYESLLDVFNKIVDHETLVEQLLLDLNDVARLQNDAQTWIMLQWFLTEQVEEVKTVQDIQARLQLVGSGGGVILIDQELGKR